MRNQMVLAVFMAVAMVSGARAAEDTLETWMNLQRIRSEHRLFQAISPSGAAAGSVMASPSKAEPDYYYHWIRDAALTMREVFELRGAYPEQSESSLKDFAQFSRLNQMTKNPSGEPTGLGLGEPKFNMDGSAYWESWGRPQNDGPALRAMVLIDFAHSLIEKGQSAWVTRNLYRAELPATTVIKADLEYTAHHWMDASFDLWEESAGDHFYTRIAQWRALKAGGEFARLMGDLGAADFYEKQAVLAAQSLDAFWSPNSKMIQVTTRETGGISWKKSKIDVAVILGVLHAGIDGLPFGADDERVMNTALLIENTFEKIYGINREKENPEHYPLGTAIGRYPEDRYDGVGMSAGNPWFLATHAFAEYYYRLARLIKSKNNVTFSAWMRPWLEGVLGYPVVTELLSQSTRQISVGQSDQIFLNHAAIEKLSQALIDRGDSFVRRSKYHSDKDGHLSEQIERDSGFLRGARDLTWNYASFLSLLRQKN